MPKILIKLRRYKPDVLEVCSYCLVNASLGLTDTDPLGCRFCQKGVDDAVKEAGFLIVEQVGEL